MKRIIGKPVSQGIGIGKIHCLDSAVNYRIKSIKQQETAAEHQRFDGVINAVINDIDETLRVLDLDKEQIEILNTHKMILSDPEMLDNVREMISNELICLEHALQRNLQDIQKLFNRMDDEYLAARSLDYKDVTQRLMSKLSGSDEKTEDWRNSIIIARELTPSQVLEAYRQKAKGILSLSGSAKSHTAILAKSLMIPCITDIHIDIENICEYNIVIVDGYNGEIIMEPDAETLAVYENKLMIHRAAQEELAELTDKEAITLDGKKVNLYCNIEIPEEIEILKKLKIEGIGLFRTEFLYIDRKQAPTEQEQIKAYKQVAEALSPHPIVIRTMDIGGDKAAEYLLEKEGNPNLGLRGIRMSFANEYLFRQQLRAILQAAVYGNIKVMFPMISSVSEIIKARKIMGECAKELQREGLKYRDDLPVGTMIEVPSAAIRAVSIARECDFLSIGTNDLVQYTLAVDRNSELVSEYYDEMNPAVLFLIKNTCEAAHKAGIKVAVCGEMASQKASIDVLIGLGVDQLSTSPAQYQEIKKIIMNIDSSKAKQTAEMLLKQ